MLSQRTLSPLSDPEALAINARGELTGAQYTALRSRLPAVFGPVCVVAVGAFIAGFILYHWPIAGAILRVKDPLPSTEHLFGHTVTIPGLRLLLALIVGGWALVFLRNVGTL